MNTAAILELDNLPGAREWCIAHLHINPERITPLAGGVSNTVLLIEAAGERIVLKQSLPQLRVEAEWLCDRQRILRECAAMQALAPVLPDGSVPEVLHEDAANYAYAMRAAPAAAQTWKAALLRGDTDPIVARRIGEILAALVRGSERSPALADGFGDIAIFDQLRLDPYYRFTAARHPDIAPAFDALIADCENNRRCLVHGDFSPKNFLVSGNQVLAIDWECVHYGNPVFDAAFLLNHLLLKGFHLPDRSEAFAQLANEFWAATDSTIDEPSVARHFAGLLLARMDGKSPVEYITGPERKDNIRGFARSLFTEPALTVAEVFRRRAEWR